MFGKRSKPTQNNNDDFAPADFDDGFADDFTDNANAAASAVVEDAWQDEETAAFADEPAAQKSSAPAKSAKKSGGALLPLVVLGVIGAGAAAYFTMPAKAPQNAEPAGQVGTLPMGSEQTAAAEPVMTPTVSDETMATPAPLEGEAALTAEQTTTASEPVASAPDMVLPDDEVPLASASSSVNATDSAPVGEADASLAAPTVDELPAMPELTTEAPVVSATPAEAQAAPADVTAAVEQPAAVAPATPAEQAAPAVAATASAPAPAPAVETAAVVSSAVASDLDARLAVLERQVSDLAKAVDKLAVAQPDLSKTVAALSKSVEGLAKDVKARPAASTSAAPVASVAPAAPVVAADTPAVSSAVPQAVSKPAAPVATKPAAPAKTNWVLRAAQDGMAWVSPTADGELQRVTVGQSLSGIGKIKSIEMVDGAWQVIGTTGRIRQ